MQGTKTYRRLLPLTVLLVLSLGRPCPAAVATERHSYQEVSANSSRTFEWILHREVPLRLVTEQPGERTATRLDEKGRTLAWRRSNVAEKTKVRVRRRGDVLLLEGTLDGQPVDRRIAIDGAPWYQAMSLSLRPFVLGGGNVARFWTLRPDTLEAYLIEARKLGKEHLRIADRQWRAEKIEVRLAGWRSLFWSARYWFEAEQGVFLRYEGPSGPPGSPVTVVTLVEPSVEMPEDKSAAVAASKTATAVPETAAPEKTGMVRQN